MIKSKILDENVVTYQNCPVVFCMSKIGGKWKPIILFLISKKVNRFGVLQRRILGISKQMLTRQLRELEQDGILLRKIFPEVPPRVEYYFSELGHSLMPIVYSMQKWGKENMPQRNTTLSGDA